MATTRREDKWPVLGRHERAAHRLQVWVDLGRAPRTIDAYARGLAEFLQVCEDHGIDPVAATRADVAVFVRELTGRASRRGTNVASIDSGCGSANATIQQRLVPVRLFYDFLMKEGVRESNPVGRGRYTPGRKWGGQQRGLVPRLVKLPWIPTEQQWLDILAIAATEPPRNRLMLALAYDAALRREELCSLRTDDLDPARRMLRVRAETTKNRLEKQLDELVKVSEAAPLLEEKGFKAVTGAKCLVAWSHEGRVRSEAAFACLAGVNPIPASSGNTVRHRLNRGGDRRLNSALHMAAITRMTHDANLPIRREAPRRRQD